MAPHWLILYNKVPGFHTNTAISSQTMIHSTISLESPLMVSLFTKFKIEDHISSCIANSKGKRHLEGHVHSVRKQSLDNIQSVVTLQTVTNFH